MRHPSCRYGCHSILSIPAEAHPEFRHAAGCQRHHIEYHPPGRAHLVDLRLQMRVSCLARIQNATLRIDFFELDARSDQIMGDRPTGKRRRRSWSPWLRLPVKLKVIALA